MSPLSHEPHPRVLLNDAQYLLGDLLFVLPSPRLKPLYYPIDDAVDRCIVELPRNRKQRLLASYERCLLFHCYPTKRMPVRC
jgi:hypothetical protein